MSTHKKQQSAAAVTFDRIRKQAAIIPSATKVPIVTAVQKPVPVSTLDEKQSSNAPVISKSVHLIPVTVPPTIIQNTKITTIATAEVNTESSGMEVDTAYPTPSTNDLSTDNTKTQSIKDKKKRSLDESKKTDELKESHKKTPSSTKTEGKKDTKLTQKPPKKKQKTTDADTKITHKTDTHSKSAKLVDEKEIVPKKKKNCRSFKRTIMKLKKKYNPGIQLPARVVDMINKIVYENDMLIQNVAQDITVTSGRASVTQQDICSAIKLCMPQAISYRYRPVSYLPKFYQPRKNKQPKKSKQH